MWSWGLVGQDFDKLCNTGLQCDFSFAQNVVRKRVSAAVVSLLCTNESQVRFLVSAIVCAFGFQSILLQILRFSGFPPASKTGI